MTNLLLGGLVTMATRLQSLHLVVRPNQQHKTTQIKMKLQLTLTICMDYLFDFQFPFNK